MELRLLAKVGFHLKLVAEILFFAVTFIFPLGFVDFLRNGMHSDKVTDYGRKSLAISLEFSGFVSYVTDV